MNPQKQLFRQPIRTLVMLLLLCVASAFLCLGFGVLSSSQETLKTIEDQFVTVAFPSTTKHREEISIGGTTGLFWVDDYTEETREFVNGLKDTASFVKDDIHQRLISAYGDELEPTTSAQEDGCYDGNVSDAPYDYIVMVGTVTAIEGQWSEYQGGENEYRYIVLRPEKILAIHPGYEQRECIEVFYSILDRGPIEESGFYVGAKVIMYGKNYVDRDLWLKTYMAKWVGGKPSEINWNNIKRNEGWDKKEEFSDYPAYYNHTDGHCVSLDEEDLKIIGRSSISLMDYEVLPEEAGISEVALTDKWSEYIEDIQVRNHSVPVLGTDLLEGMYLFHEKEAFVTQGRSFEKADYEKGSPVCLISETLATSSGLQVGSVIDLTFYEGDLSPWKEFNVLNSGRDRQSNPTAGVYMKSKGDLGRTVGYEVIGIYRQADIWLGSSAEQNADGSFNITESYSFTPNTVFVPNASLEGLPTCTSDSGIYSTMVLKNGSIEEMKAALEAAGYSPDALTYFDGGYSELVGTLNSFRESAGQLFLASVLTWLAAAVVYLALFVLRQRRNAGLMVSLGSGRRRAAGFIWVISMLPVLAASAVGALVGMALMNGTLEKVFASVQDVLSSDFSSTAGGHISVESTLVALPWTAALAALGQGLIFAALIWLCAAAITRRKPLDNLKGT